MNFVDPDLNYYSDAVTGNGVITLSDFNSTVVSDHVNNILLLSLNIRSFHKHKDELMAMLSTMRIQPDILVLTETWLKRDDVVYADIAGFDAAHTVRDSRRSGGVSIYCRQKYKMKVYSNLSVCNTNIESCSVSVDMGTDNLNILGIYRPHSGTDEQFMIELGSAIECADLTDRGKLCVVGDFNINLLDENSESVINLVSYMQSSHLLPLIKHPTRYPAGIGNVAPTLLDHMYVSFLDSLCSGVLAVDITDHCAIFMQMPIASQKLDGKVELKFRDQSTGNMDRFKQELSAFQWDFEQFGDINSKFKHFNE